MKRHIGQWAILGATVAALASVTVVAAAHDPAGPGRGPIAPNPGAIDSSAGTGAGTWNTGSYLDSLKTELGITASQASAWKDYADATLSAGAQVQGQDQTMSAAMSAASWQERRNMMNQMFLTRQQLFDTVHQAASRLLPALDPTQQARAQSILPGLA